MREIKFRAWNSQVKKMIDLQKITPLAMDAALLSLGARGLFLPFDKDMILMQFTGLLDKNGKEIYEGDIVMVEGREKGVIDYDMGCFRIGFSAGSKMALEDISHLQIEVIGNIHEQAGHNF